MIQLVYKNKVKFIGKLSEVIKHLKKLEAQNKKVADIIKSEGRGI